MTIDQLRAARGEIILNPPTFRWCVVYLQRWRCHCEAAGFNAAAMAGYDTALLRLEAACERVERGEPAESLTSVDGTEAP